MNTSLDGASLKERHLVDESPDYSDERTMYVCFLVHMYLEMQRGDLAMQAIQVALPIFPSSLSLRAQIGLAQYSARDYDKAQASFEMIRDADPYRVAHIDTYSNILYIKEKHADLSLLAHTLVKVDKYAPETCCVVGNYYSLKGQHDRAITYFQRAIAVNSQYLSAWTLMGHEYIELHNSATAITCYRQALNISESDFRAWYGLGQTYEMLHLYQYASYYFRKAAVLRPGDARMWSAVGNCLLKLGSRDEAIAVFERAVQCGDSEGISTRELAKLCR
jgi:anaphase-promoting complex subunit 8